MLRNKITEMLQTTGKPSKLNRRYDTLIMVVAVLSLIPLMFKNENTFLSLLDHLTVYVLFFDYIMRWVVYDKLSRLKRPWAFILYPVHFLSIIDLLALLPSLGLLGQGFRVLRILRLFKLLHYSKSFMKIVTAFKKERKVLTTVLFIAIVYIFISALILFSYEPDTFESFFEALYWATTALTTVGYGDIAPTSDIGRLISMISSLFGIAVIALPAGIITTSFVEELSKGKEDENNNHHKWEKIKQWVGSKIYQETAPEDEASSQEKKVV